MRSLTMLVEGQVEEVSLKVLVELVQEGLEELLFDQGLAVEVH